MASRSRGRPRPILDEQHLDRPGRGSRGSSVGEGDLDIVFGVDPGAAVAERRAALPGPAGSP
jgi:hypothetical protein